MGLADLHIHSIFSHDGTCTVPAILKYVKEKTTLDVIAITDHDNLDGALEAEQLGPAYGVEVIPGCEITTAEGHLLALFIHRPVPPGLPLLETVRRVGEQGGLCIAAHPGARGTQSLPLPAVYRVMQHPDGREVLVGIETTNTGQLDQKSAWAARAMADVFQISQVGCSDAHLLWMIGMGATVFPGSGAAALRQALLSGETEPVSNGQPNPLRLVGGFLSGYLLHKAAALGGSGVA